jgi:hypothetical protein
MAGFRLDADQQIFRIAVRTGTGFGSGIHARASFGRRAGTTHQLCDSFAANQKQSLRIFQAGRGKAKRASAATETRCVQAAYKAVIAPSAAGASPAVSGSI